MDAVCFDLLRPSHTPLHSYSRLAFVSPLCCPIVSLFHFSSQFFLYHFSVPCSVFVCCSFAFNPSSSSPRSSPMPSCQFNRRPRIFVRVGECVCFCVCVCALSLSDLNTDGWIWFGIDVELIANKSLYDSRALVRQRNSEAGFLVHPTAYIYHPFIHHEL